MNDTSFSCPKNKLDRLCSLYRHDPVGIPKLLEIPFLNTRMASGVGYFQLYMIIIIFVICCSMMVNLKVSE